MRERRAIETTGRVTARDAHIFDRVQASGGSSARGWGADSGGCGRAEDQAQAALRVAGGQAQARIAELERKIGKQQMDLDFFREALRLIDARDRSSRATPSTRSLKK